MKEKEYMNDTSMSGLESSLTELVDSLEAVRRLNEPERRPAGGWIGIAAAAANAPQYQSRFYRLQEDGANWYR